MVIEIISKSPKLLTKYHIESTGKKPISQRSEWKAVNHLSKVMGEQRKKGENSCSGAALKQHTAFKISS